jgi:hypothetical protein
VTSGDNGKGKGKGKSNGERNVRSVFAMYAMVCGVGDGFAMCAMVLWGA